MKDRNLLPSVDKFDAIIIHIRGLPNDWPEKRSEKQRYSYVYCEAGWPFKQSLLMTTVHFLSNKNLPYVISGEELERHKSQ